MKHSNGNSILNDLINNIINMYNNTIYSTIKMAPIVAFTSKDRNIISQIKKNTENRQKNNSNNLGFKKNNKCLFSSNIKLSRNTVQLLFKKKG